MKAIPLTNSSLVAIVDDEDYGLVSRYRWSATKGWNTATVYAYGYVNGRTERMHVLILGREPGKVTDHIDNNGLNNTRANLRLVTPLQNTTRQRRRHNAIHPYRGITRSTSRRWGAQIGRNGKSISLGQFDTPEEAARAYDRAAWEAWGEFAALNFPEEIELLDQEAA